MHVVCCQIRADYTEVEVEALRWLSAGSILDGWCSPILGSGPSPELWESDPEQARALEKTEATNRRYATGCSRLFRRGVVERRRDPIDRRCWAYRLPENLRTAVELALPPARA